ncbi:MAG: hypothetical protein ACPLYW_02150 [Candidatus Nanoarchaeia archaeon]
MLFKKKESEPQIIQVNLVDVIKQAAVQMKYEEIGSWLVTHNTPLFWCHEKGFTIVDKNFIEKRSWLKRALNRMVKEIEEQKQTQMKNKIQNQIENIDKIDLDKVGYVS